MVAKRILVVDDEPHIVKSLDFVLKAEGFEVIAAHDGEEALIKAREGKPDLILLDVMLPKKDGFKVCAELRKDAELKGTYIIMLTARSQPKDKISGMLHGADEYIAKPFSPTKVLARVKEVLE